MTRPPAARRTGRGAPVAPWPGAAFWLGMAAAVAVIFVLRTAYFYFGDAAAGVHGTLLVRLMAEGTGALGALALFPLVVWVARRFAPPRVGWPASVAAHLVGFALFSVGHTLFLAASRAVLAPALGLHHYEYGPLHLRIPAEAGSDAITYVIVLGALALVDAATARRERELRALELEREVARMQIENLQLQLQPHFLFNALNTISSVMYDDPAAADEMVGHLSDLLRHALGTTGRREVPFGEELALLESYLALARARFGPRLELDLDVTAEARPALVPPLLLQPLVENAIRHGIAPTGRGRVAVRARREGDALLLQVENDAPPEPVPGEAGSGHALGLALTRRRLELLHGAMATVEAAPAPAQGTYRVTIRLPYRAAGIAAPDHALATPDDSRTAR